MQNFAVDHRLEGHVVDRDLGPPLRVGESGYVGNERALGIQQRLDGDPGQTVGVRADPQSAGQLGGHLGRRVGPQAVLARAALGYGPSKETLGPGHGQQGGDAHGSGRLAGDGHPFGVAAERRDVVLHPGQRSYLIEQSPVGQRALQEGEAVHSQAVVDGDAHHAVTSERAPW